ncbi:aldehyde dehydrogenase [Phyllobacterium sp. SB3]|uniref:aldehyde dehydrogenase n=1 Tax=Phyllobacterium sp. SB3 TaxID=3156073 RepID=UPI0032AEA2BC
MNNWKASVPNHLFDSFYVDGLWVRAASGISKEIINPSTEKLSVSMPMASEAEMDNAIQAAKHAFEQGAWPRTTPRNRCILMHRLADRLSERIELAAQLWTAQVGAPISLTRKLAPLATLRLRYFADLAASFEFESERSTQHGHAKILSEPIGACAIIIPWNAPLPILMTKLGAALAAGCTCVIKSSPESPLDAMLLAQCVHEIGFPPGVINVLMAGAGVSSHLVKSNDIPKVSFTGSVRTGSEIASIVAGRMGRLTLELGGKSAAILLENADFDKAMPTLEQYTMPFSGQFCFSQSRVLVPKSREGEFLDAFATMVRARKVGDPWDTSTQVGPVLNSSQFERVMAYINEGIDEGAEIVCGGKRSSFSERGYYIEPTVIRNVDRQMSIAREEIFGPVVTVQTYETVDEAIEIANDTDFGLSGSIFGDSETAMAVARCLRTGQVGINGMELTPSAPFGGYKMSGVGREGGPEGLQAFLETKAVIFPDQMVY